MRLGGGPRHRPWSELLRLWLALVGAGIAMAAVAVLQSRAAHEAQLRHRCGEHIRQLAHAVLGYRETHGGFYPPGTVSDTGLAPEKRLSWITLIYNYLDESQSVELLFDSSAAWDCARIAYPRFASLTTQEGRPEATPTTSRMV